MKGSRSRSARSSGVPDPVVLASERPDPLRSRVAFPVRPSRSQSRLHVQPVMAQQQLEEIIVTAQKRAENMQDVPISIQAIGTEQLEQLHVNNFKDYVAMLPSVTMAPGAGGGYGAGAGYAAVYMRGVTTGGDGQAITSVPSVGMYLDEQPITTIQGNLDIHMYDIARVEALAGPQGTLYGASSQAGTIRIITNRPDPPASTPVTASKPTWSTETMRATSPRASSTCRSGTGRDPARGLVPRGCRLCRQRAGDAHVLGGRKRSGRRHHGQQRSSSPRTTTTRSRRTARARRCAWIWTTTGRSRRPFMIQNQYSDGSWGDDLNDFMVVRRQRCRALQGRVHRRRVVAGRAHHRRQHQQLRPHILRQLPRPHVEASFDYSDYSFFYDSIYYDRVLRRSVLRQQRRSGRSAMTIAGSLVRRASLLQRRRVHEAEPRAAHQLAAGQAGARSARLLLAGAEARLLAVLPRGRVSRTSCCRTRGPIRGSPTSCISTAWIARTPTRPCSPA